MNNSLDHVKHILGNNPVESVDIICGCMMDHSLFEETLEVRPELAIASQDTGFIEALKEFGYI